MTKEEFEKFKKQWYEENKNVPIIDTANVNEDVVNEIFREMTKEVFNILEKYNEKKSK